MKAWRLCCTVVLIASMTHVSWAQGKPKITIITEGKTGFKEGDKFYPLGMDAKEFVSKFGPPDRKNEGSLEYHGDGMFLSLKDGKIINMQFYLQGIDGTKVGARKFKAADAQTDKGVKAGMSLRDITKAQGKPDNSKEFPDSTYHEYKWGTITTGKDGVKSIMLFTRKPS